MRTTGHMHKKLGEDRMCITRDVLADRQTDTVITILRSAVGGGVRL